MARTDASNHPTKAELQVEGGERFTFLFNPAELRITKSNKWDAPSPKGKNAPKLRFQQGESGSLSFKATFDTTDDGRDVTAYTDGLLALMHTDEALPGSDQQRNQARPPWVRFHWGNLHSFKAVIDQLAISFTYFGSTGTALRAVAEVTLKQYEDDTTNALQNPTSHTPEPQRVHRLQPGETLDRVAAAYYGDASRWRRIARANDIVDPLVLQPGWELTIPEPEVVSRG